MEAAKKMTTGVRPPPMFGFEVQERLEALRATPLEDNLGFWIQRKGGPMFKIGREWHNNAAHIFGYTFQGYPACLPGLFEVIRTNMHRLEIEDVHAIVIALRDCGVPKIMELAQPWVEFYKLQQPSLN